MRKALTVAGPTLGRVTISSLAWPDEAIGSVQKVNPPPRFQSYRPDVSVHWSNSTFEYPSGTRTLSFHIANDSDRYVASLP